MTDELLDRMVAAELPGDGMQALGQEYKDVTILLDGRAYVGCSFIRCQLEYHGTSPIHLVNCRMEDCGVTYRGAAGMAVEALQLIARSGPQGLDHVMRLFVPTADVDWTALPAATRQSQDV